MTLKLIIATLPSENRQSEPIRVTILDFLSENNHQPFICLCRCRTCLIGVTTPDSLRRMCLWIQDLTASPSITAVWVVGV
ncbi:hypothetical protein Hanom_Chr15g01413591 [Helianthus anomalus]